MAAVPQRPVAGRIVARLDVLGVLPAAFAPRGQAGTLGAQRGVVTVAGVDDGGVVVDVEHPGGDVVEQPLEIAGLPSLADSAGEQAIAGEQLSDAAGGRAVEGQCDRSRRVPAQMDDLEGQLADLRRCRRRPVSGRA